MTKALAFYTGLFLMVVTGCDSANEQVESTAQALIAPFDVPTSAPRPEAGEPIERFVTRWNAWVDSVREDQRVGNAIEQANERLIEKLHQIPDTPEGYDAWWALDLAKPGFLWEEAGEVYKAISPELDMIRDLAHRDAIAIPLDLDSEDDVLYALTLYASAMRGAMMGLAGRVRHLVLAGRAQESIEDVIAIFEMQRLVEESPMMVGYLTAMACKNFAWSTVLKTLSVDSDAYTDEQLSVFQGYILDWVEPDVSQMLKTEEYFGIFNLQEVCTPSGEFSAEMTQAVIELYRDDAGLYQAFDDTTRVDVSNLSSSTARFAPLEDQVAMLQRMTTLLIEDIESYPPTQRALGINQLVFQLIVDGDSVAYLPALQITKTNGLTVSIVRKSTIEARAAVVLLAIHRHRIAAGRWPETLEEIALEHMHIDPIDLHTGKPFGYKIVDRAPFLWSGGPDRDDDNGYIYGPFNHPDGTLAKLTTSWFTLDQWDAMGENEQEKYNGDWILFPPNQSSMWGNEED